MKQQNAIGIERFGGVYAKLHQSPSFLDGQAMVMRNFRMTADGFLRRREGYQKFCRMEGSVRGFCFGIDPKTNGEVVFFCSGPSLYLRHYGETGSYYLTTFSDMTLNGAVSLVFLDNRLYLLDGEELYYWDETGSGKVPGYVPLCYTDLAPLSGIGSTHEAHNSLCPYARATYSFNEYNRLFLLPEQAESVVWVKAGGVDRTFQIVQGYSDHSRLQVNLDDNATPGKNAVEICYRITDTGRRQEILQNKHVFLYGGSDDMRVFLYGNRFGRVEYSVSRTQHSYAMEYFPEDGYINIGTGPVTGIVRRYNHLLVHTQKETFAVESSSDGYNIYLVHDRIGNQLIGYAQAIGNDSVSVSNGSIFRIKTTSVEGDRTVVCISDKIAQHLTAKDLENGLCTVNPAENEVWFATPQAIWVYRYDCDAWYTFDNPGVKQFFLYHDHQVGFLTKDGLYVYQPHFDTDDGQRISAVFQSAPFAPDTVRTPLCEAAMKVWDADGSGAVTMRLASYDDAIAYRCETVLSFSADECNAWHPLRHQRLRLHAGAEYAMRLETTDDVTIAFCGLRIKDKDWEAV